MTKPNPFHTLREMAAGYFLPRCLHVVADLAVADVLDETPRTAADLAAAVGAHPDALGRVLRLLSAYGVFESQDDKFRHSPASRLLRTDHPQSMRDFARMCGMSINWAVCGQLDYSVRTGLPAADQIHPGGFWAYLTENPEANSIFNATMTAKAHGQVAGILASYDFSGFGLIGDIGGGRGHLLRAVLDSTPTARGVLFDQPHVIKETTGIASERLTLQAGDFFNDALPVCDAYLVMEVIHDWADKEAVAILKAIREAAPSHAKLLLLETMIPSDPGPDWSKILDILMLNWAGGRQRTLKEYETLFDSAGFSLTREIVTGADISIIEARTA
jgi:hypothetical protein